MFRFCWNMAAGLSEDELRKKTEECKTLRNLVKEYQQTADLLLSNWREEILNRSTEEKDVFLNGKLIAAPCTTFEESTEKLAETVSRAVSELGSVLEELKPHVDLVWKTAQLHTRVCRKPENQADPSYVEDVCEQVCECLDSLVQCVSSTSLASVDNVRAASSSRNTEAPSMSSDTALKAQFEADLKELINSHINKLLVVFTQPPLTMRGKNSHGVSDTFSTSVGILGGRGFGDHVTVEAAEMTLCDEEGLSSATEKPATGFKIHKAGDGAEVSPHRRWMKEFEGLEMIDFVPKKGRTPVDQNLYRVLYSVKISFNLPGWTFETQILSLPILIRPKRFGHREHTGVQLWYSCAAANMLEPRAPFPLEMAIADVITMMDERIRFIGGRALKPYEKAFLETKLRRSAKKMASTHLITLEEFFQDKMVLPPQREGAGEEEMRFSLWTWFHAVVNLLEETVRQPWLDGVIYGFASREHCREALGGQPDGTCVLRFSESMVQTRDRSKPTGALGPVDVRDGDVIFWLPETAAEIKATGLAKLTADRVASRDGHGTFVGDEASCNFMQSRQWMSGLNFQPPSPTLGDSGIS